MYSDTDILCDDVMLLFAQEAWSQLTLPRTLLTHRL
jgi:hypothetical protein